MPDVREVYEMVTKQKPSDPRALERQRTRQIRMLRKRKIGTLALVAGLAAVAVVAFVATRTEAPSRTGTSPNATAEEIATSFMGAYGDHDADRVVSYLADGADVDLLVTSIGDAGDLDLEGLRLSVDWLEAVGYEQDLDSCLEAGRSATTTRVHCSFDIDMLGSAELERGPFGPVGLDLTIRGGKIVLASAWDFDTEPKFGPTVWEPFRDWVYATHPGDAEVMFAVEGTYPALSEESNLLWGRNFRRYVEAVRAGKAD